MTMAPDDVIRAAASVARDAGEGRLSPAALQEQALAECRELCWRRREFRPMS